MHARRKFMLPLLGVVLILFSVLPAMAQQTLSGLSVRITSVDVDDFPEVVFEVTVRDANGVPIPDLEEDAFEVNEDRLPLARPISKIKSVVSQDLPVELVVLLDISGSMTGKPLADAKLALQTLVDGMGTKDKIALIAFAKGVDLDGLNAETEIQFTRDEEEIMTLVNGLTANGSTPLYDALYKGVIWAEQATLGHRALIILTDGVDEEPGSLVASAETPIQQAIRSNVPIFSIGLGGDIDSGYLDRVARVTGGTYQETPDSEQLTELFVNVQKRLKQQYEITFDSELLEDGKAHRLQVNVDTLGRIATHEVAMGPLPEPPPTATPTPTPRPTPTPTPIAVEEKPEKPTGFFRSIWWALGNIWAWFIKYLLWILGSLLLLALLVVFFMSAARSGEEKVAKLEFCAVCGRSLAADEACLACGPSAGRVRYVEQPTQQVADNG